MKSKTQIKNKPTGAIKKLNKISKSMGGANLVKVGLPKESDNYPDGTSLIMVGAAHEFGSPKMGVPERSYLRSTLNNNAKGYKKLFKKLSRNIIAGRITKKQALQLLGLQLQSDVIKTIISGIDPPLSYREGTPLNDTGHLKQSITYQVGK